MPQLDLGRHGERPFSVDADHVVTGRTCVMGASGSGKSYLVAVICEELCKAGVPFLIVDTEGEYHTLKEKYDLLWVGDEPGCDVRWSELRLGELAAASLQSQPIILDLSGVDDQRSLLGTYLTALYAEVSRRRLPYLVVLEEADRFIPQAGERLPILDEIARRGRKRGLGLIVCTQRPSVVDKNVLSQCSSQLIGRLVIKNDLQAVSHFFPGQQLPKQLTTLPPGSFYAMGDLSQQPVQIAVRARETSHGGSTPLLSSRPPSHMIRYLGPRSEEPIGPKPPAEAPPSVQEGSKPRLGLPSRIDAKDVPLLVKRARTYFLFGGREMVTAVQEVLVPVAELTVRLRVGMIKKHFETRYLLLDARNGRSVDLSQGISFGPGVSQLVGLDQRDVEVLLALEPKNEATAFDLMGRVRLSEDIVRQSLRRLEERRLALSYRRGRVKVYRRSVDVPKVGLFEAQQATEPMEEGGSVAPVALAEDDMRQLVRGLFEGGELDGVSYFYYPLHRVRLELDSRARTVWIDARTGRQVESAEWSS
ncbi:MAG TPA: DUF87 domain-containing protein [Conexivisphaerales archaeon]|nr:DUF87 domain-containing protein [Conexivisphaerales archaeon]